MKSGVLTETLRETRAVFDDSGEPLTTPEVAERLDLGRRTTYARLERLVEQDQLETKKVGANARVWWSQAGISKTHEGQATRLEHRRDELESEFDQVFERISDGFYALDDQFRFLYLNEHAREILGLDTAVLGRSFLDAVTVTDAFEQALYEALKTQEPVIFEDYYEPVDRWYDNALYPSESGLSVYFRDITERKRRQQELERYVGIVDAIGEPVYEVDMDGRFVFVNDAFVEESGYEESELLGKHVSIGMDREAIARAGALIGELLESGSDETAVLEYEVITSSGERNPVENRFSLLTDEEGGTRGTAGILRDITERRERERALRDAKAKLEAATEAGEVGIWEWHIPEDRVVTGTWLAETFGISPDAAHEGISPDIFKATIHEDDRDRVMEALTEAISSCDAYEEEFRIWDVEDTLRWMVARGRVACDEDGTPLTFPGVVTDITERKQAELELERQHEQLETLNSLNNIVSGIISSVIDGSTREEIEQAACDALAAADAYEFAWLAEVDPHTDTIEPRVTARTRGYAEEVTISLDPDRPGGQGPAAMAIREQERQVVQDVFSDPTFEPWRETAAEYGFTAVATIPVVHEETVYGVLAVYADRENAFDTAESEVVSQLGKVVGHAIAAIERKRALTSDEVVELEFQVQDIFAALDVPVETDGTITIDAAVPVDDDEFLVYGTATPDAIDAVTSLCETVPGWERLTVHSDGDLVRFKARLAEPPVISTVAAFGGYVEQATIEDSDYRITIHLSPSVDLRQVIDAIEDAYPQAEMLRRQQISRLDDDSRRIERHFVEGLTERQRATLDAAYYAGYFEWPRRTDGTELAESLGLAPPTVNQHLRKAQRKVFDSLYSAGP